MNEQPFSKLITGRDFDQYQPSLQSRFLAYNFKYNLTYCQPTDNPALRIDLESQLHLGRITLWESGACEMEVLDIETGQTVFSESHMFCEEKEFFEYYSRLVLYMRDGTGWLQ